MFMKDYLNSNLITLKMKSNIRPKTIRQAFMSTLLLAATCLLFVQCKTPSGDNGKQLEQGFLTPPDAAKPRVWWHWIDGNVTKEGIRADLEWMHRVGIGGFHNFDIGESSPQIVEKRLVYMSPEWKDAIRFTAKLADSLGLEMTVAGSPGFSETGGPWVEPRQAMKKFVWSETRIEGGKPFSGVLPAPPKTTGPIQNVKVAGGFGLNKEYLMQIQEYLERMPEYYADVAVVAFRISDNDFSMMELQPKITSSGGKFNLAELTDGDLVKSTLLPSAPVGENAWLQFEFDKPEAIQALTIVAGGGGGMFGMGGASNNRILEVSDDGKIFRKVIDITSGRIEQKTLAFEPVTGKYFRICFKTQPPSPQAGMFFMPTLEGLRGDAAPSGTQIDELVLHTGAYVNRFEEKAAFAAATDLYAASTPDVSNAIARNNIIDLTSKMGPGGKLTWTPPEGKWIVLRLGYSLLGTSVHPAQAEATGLEVDKLSAGHVKAYLTYYLDQFQDATGGLMGKKGLQYLLTDSWEAGVQNWTDNMMAEFKNRRGYDMLPWLPVLTGHVVESAEASDRFLWDFRKTLSDLLAENHYDQMTKLLKERGMKRYSESHEGGRAFIGDGMEAKRTAAIPMGATWTPENEGGVETRYKADVRESASVSHIYGQNLVAAESMTARTNIWGWSPELLKPTADMELACGLNRFVIHCSVHQPVDDKIPGLGLGLGGYGQWFTRHETWAEQAGAWVNYLSRSSYMLQQGKFIADVIYFYGEDNNIAGLFGQKLPDVPEGYSYDFVNSDALINILAVKNNELVTPGGMRYKVLALDPNARYMTLPVLLKIKDMVRAGAVVIGEKPISSPSLSDNQNEFKALADQLWTGKGETIFGEGKVYSGKTIKEVLELMNIAPDFTFTMPDKNTNLIFVHRKAGDIDFYWVNNRNTRTEDLEVTFRVEGKSAEIWHPETGKIEQASYYIANGLTRVPLHLESSDAVFVVFRNKAKETSRTITRPTEKQLTVINGTWNLSFQANRGAPAQITLNSLTPWNENPDNGVKYFSGTGTYTNTINAPEDWFKEKTQIWLDLGTVKNLAEVTVNGKSLGIVWKFPFRVNITEALKQGDNTLEVKVTNLWVNRLIGDQQPGVTNKITYTTQAFYRADSPLHPSGLLGPVQLLSLTNQDIEK
jgi:hypothetical protein